MQKKLIEDSGHTFAFSHLPLALAFVSFQ